MKLVEIITKDIKYDNESKKPIVSLRLLYIILFISFVLNVIWTRGAVFRYYGLQTVILAVLMIFLFVQTYFVRTRLALIEFNVYLIAWIYMMIPCFGWHAGLQNYLLILIMLFFFATHVKLASKVLFSVAVLAFRFHITFFYEDADLSLLPGSMPEIYFEITNIVAIFVAVVLFSYLYSKETIESESKLMKYNERLETAAHTDPLTGLYNRRYTYEILEGMHDSAAGTSISIAMGDIDFFKEVNDTYGHDAGDEVLKAISAVMKKNTSPGGFVARWGGEEFLIVYPDINGDRAHTLLKSLHREIGELVIKYEEVEIRVTMTFGLTEFDFGNDVDHTIKRADDNLYIGKKTGRNRIVY